MPATDSIDSLHIAYATAPAPSSYDTPTGFVRQDGISTVLFDSIASDTATSRIPHFIPVDEADSLRAEALADSFPAIEVRPVPSGLREGIAPTALQPDGGSTALSAIMIGILILAAINASGMARALKSYKAELWSIRRRPNVFDDETSVRLPIAILLGFIFIIFGGITLYYVPVRPAQPSLAGAVASMGLAGAYYFLQICAYGMIGYAFADEEQNRRWMGGFFGSQAFAGLGMALPAIVAVACPILATAAITVSVSVYALAHAIFIIKGFRIFYYKIASLLYFILYLCTLEIIPLLGLYAISLYFTETIR